METLCALQDNINKRGGGLFGAEFKGLYMFGCVEITKKAIVNLSALFLLKWAELFKVYWDSFLLQVYCNLQFIAIVSYSRITVILSLIKDYCYFVFTASD